jgi:putative transposase
MQLNAFGRMVERCWRAIPDHFPNVELGAYVVMPNHVHGIIVIHEGGMGTIFRAHTRTAAEQFGKPMKGSLSTIFRTYKAAVTRNIGQKNIWQRNYYEHIIRGEKEWNRIHRYIEADSIHWKTDSNHSSNL